MKTRFYIPLKTIKFIPYINYIKNDNINSDKKDTKNIFNITVGESLST